MAIARREVLKRLLAWGLPGAALGAAGYGALYERRHFRLVQERVLVAGLPPALAGLRIALVSDLHRSSYLSEAELHRVVSLVLSAEPDLVALAGDYVTFKDKTYIGSCAEALGRLRAPFGVVAVMGNHDDEPAMRRALAARGIAVLDNDLTRLAIRGETLSIAGVSYWTTRPQKIRAVLAARRGTTILLAHDPRRIREARMFDVPLLLSGHTHGGQVVLPVLGAVAARKYPIAGGTLRQGGTTLHVSRGVGTVFVPYRFNCPPEVSVLTLEGG